MPIVLARDNIETRLLNGSGLVLGEQTQFRIGAGSRPLDEPECRNELPRHGQSADRKIIDRPLRLCAPQRVLGNL